MGFQQNVPTDYNTCILFLNIICERFVSFLWDDFQIQTLDTCKSNMIGI